MILSSTMMLLVLRGFANAAHEDHGEEHHDDECGPC